jgi:O-acetyl-ADP-ribose deacetylase (regulator of RNase III)
VAAEERLEILWLSPIICNPIRSIGTETSTPMPATIRLVDRQPEVVAAWKYQFEDVEPSPDISEGDVFESSADALVLPGNAFGFLDRGLEMQACERWGFELQDRIRETVRGEFHGELLVGQAALIPLENAEYRFLIYVAQSRTCASLDSTLGAYLAARGAFATVREAQGSAISSVVIPGIGTGHAGLHPAISARQLRYAYEIHAGLRRYGDKNLTQLTRRERKLSSLPKSLLKGSENSPEISASGSPESS